MRLITCLIDERGGHLRVFDPPDALHLYVVHPAAVAEAREARDLRRMLEEIREELAALM